MSAAGEQANRRAPGGGAAGAAIPAAKAAQRREAARRRADLSPAARARAEEAIQARVLELCGLGGPPVLAYAALDAEASVAGCIARWLAAGRTVALPRVAGPGVLALHGVSDLAVDLAPGTYGILEPLDDRPVVAPDAVGCVVVPGVAFDRRGYRLGYGGGFYDRLLATLDAPLVLGVCFEVQLVEAVVREPHDVPVDAVLTEGGVYR